MMSNARNGFLVLILSCFIFASLIATASAQGTAPPEFRGLWVDTWGTPGPYDADSVTTLVDTAYNAGYNAILLQVRKCGDAYYNSAYEPWATNIVVTDPPYDPLADCLAKAHAKGIEVHAWVIPYRIWNKNWPNVPDYHVFKTHPEWLHQTFYGAKLVSSYYELDPGCPFAQQYIIDVLKDLVSKYDIDGVNFDRIRYPENSYWGSGYSYNTWGYNPITCERFRREYGVYPPTSPTSPHWAAWCQWRRDQITDLVRKAYAECVYIRPQIKMSADTIGWLGGNPVTDFTSTRAYKEVFQDHQKWMKEHLLDMNILMNYKREHESAQAADYRLWTQYLAQNKYGRHSIDGPAAYLNSIQGTITQIGVARDAGLEGVCTYSYRSTNKDSLPNQQFYDAIKAGPFALPAPVPDMPWKSAPTEGILFGQVSDALMPNDPVYGNWICKAEVSITGPVSKSMFTDGTGTFVFMDLPPGEYTVSVTKSGYKPASKTASVSAGLATRVDFQLNLVDGYSIYEALSLPDGTMISLPGNVVTSPTGKIEGCIYVESENRLCGIKVKPVFWTPELALGDRVCFVGVLATENGERVLDQAWLHTRTSGTPLGALAVKIKDLALPPSTTALLLQVTGKVIESGDGWFKLDDGSGIVRVLCPGKTIPTSVARVTGICRFVAGQDEPERVIQVRYQSDIESEGALAWQNSPPGAVRKGYNLIGVPCAPADYSPGSVFAGIDIAGKLFAWDGSNWLAYDPMDESQFGILRGEGYALESLDNASVAYYGFNDEGAADMRITLPKTGWNLISQPFSLPSRYADMQLTDGVQLLSVPEAQKADWVMPLLFTWDNAKQRLAHVWMKQNGKGQTEWVLPWQGYWVRTHRDDLALIINKPQQR